MYRRGNRNEGFQMFQGSERMKYVCNKCEDRTPCYFETEDEVCSPDTCPFDGQQAYWEVKE